MADDSNSTFVPDTSNVVTHPREQMRLLREKLAEAAQRLIDAMDAIDGDPDLEPSLGSVGASVSNPWATLPSWSEGTADDREDEHDGREEFLEGDDNEDREPDETDSWYVNPHSLNQDGMRWIQGETPAGFPEGPRFVPGI